MRYAFIMKHIPYLTILLIILISSCESPISTVSSKANDKAVFVDPQGSTIKERFRLPQHYERPILKTSGFAQYLQNFPLKPHGSKVYYFNKEAKHTQSIHAAVFDIDTGKRDLQQCADAVMRLRAEYLYHEERFDDIHFNFTNGFFASYTKWRSGQRIKVQGNDAFWIPTQNESKTYSSFRKYMDMVFSYAGTLSLSNELQQKQLADLQIGDVFIQGGSPGHAVLVVDMAIHKETKDKIFLLAQSYMPAQDIHVLKNINNKDIGPWYSLANINSTLTTPEWTFQAKDLKSF